MRAQLIADYPQWAYFGGGEWTSRRLRLWRMDDGRLVAMLTENPGDPGTSLVNAAEEIAAKLAVDHPGETIVHIEHYPADPGMASAEHFDAVTVVGGAAIWRDMPRAEVIATFGDIFAETAPAMPEPDLSGWTGPLVHVDPAGPWATHENIAATAAADIDTEWSARAADALMGTPRPAGEPAADGVELYDGCEVCGGIYSFGPSRSRVCATCAQAPE
jgi:hypothetical protein